MASVKYIKTCKVCNSKFRNVIEDLHVQGMNPQKIYDYLQSLTDPAEQILVAQEDIKPSSIRRHLDNHFDVQDGAKIKLVDTQKRVDQSRDSYNKGVKILIDKVNAVSHLIETAMIRIEEVESLPSSKEKHTFTINYMNTVKGLIDQLAKLTGDLKQEGTIDINFFSNEISRFAEIVLLTIRSIDKQLGMDNKLEYAFAIEFKKQWEMYVTRQNKILNGEMLPNDGERERNVNTFNEGV
jgi:hypothetical protein